METRRQLITRWGGGPCTAVARGDVDEIWLEMHVGVVGQRVVLWIVFERTWCCIVDGDGYCC